jgi:hypothetical protein
MDWRSGGLTALPLAALLAGCATTPPPAVTAFARQDCAAAPDLAGAISLTPPKEKAEFVVTTPVGAGAACLARPGGAAPYVLYALPADFDDKTLMVGANLEAARVLSPEVSILDGQGQVTRRFGEADYLFRGTVYSVQFRPKVGEAYLLVAADPARVGQSFEAIHIGTSTTSTVIPVGGAYATANWTSGVDQKVARTFSYEGAIEVTVFDSDTKTRR